jgi:hypothetical protein
LRELLGDWRNLLPVVGLVVLAVAGIFFWLRRKPSDEGDVERERRAYLNRVGRIVEGQVLEIVEHGRTSLSGDKDSPDEATPGSGRPGISSGKHAPAFVNGSQRLLYYTYAISGVTYETAQDITGLEERLHLTRIAAGQIASVKYDPSNPSNSILLADDWSGLH